MIFYQPTHCKPANYISEADFTLSVATCQGEKIVCVCPTTHSHSYSTGAPLRRLGCAKKQFQCSQYGYNPLSNWQSILYNSRLYNAHMSFFYQVVYFNKLKSLTSHQSIKIQQTLAKLHNQKCMLHINVVTKFSLAESNRSFQKFWIIQIVCMSNPFSQTPYGTVQEKCLMYPFQMFTWNTVQ